jgi:uncharacterized DUF497 family protein
METRFTWTPAKAQRNLRDHGISFETAAEAFDDPNHFIRDNDFLEDQGEQRQDVIGLTRGLVLLVFVDRSEDGIEVIHIISARKAEKYEINIYTAQIDN